MAETSSNVTIQDVPEYMKPYRQALLNAAFGLTFTPQYLQQQGLNMAPTYNQPTQQPYPPPNQPGNPDFTSIPRTPVAAAPNLSTSLIGKSAADIEAMLKANRIGYASGGRLADAAQEIEKALLAQGAAPAGSDVWLSPGGTPLGGAYPGTNVSPTPNLPFRISTNTQTPGAPQPPAVTPPTTAGPGGIIATPPSGTLTPGNPNPNPPNNINGVPAAPNGHSTGQTPGQLPGAPGGGTAQTAGGAVAPMFVPNRPAGFAGAAQAASMGYNPAQYADDSVAAGLARRMGAQEVYTNPIGPGAPPSQATLYSGGESFQNAGLVNDAYTRFANDPGQLQLRLQGIRDEIRSLGGTPGFKGGGVLRAANGMHMQSDPTIPYTPPTAAPATTTPAAQTNLFGPKSADITTPEPVNGSMPPSQIPSFSALQPYQAFQGNRVLGNGANFGQVGSSGAAQISDLSRNALSGYSSIPSAFDPDGQIRADRDTAGHPTTNYGIANDMFDTAGNYAIGATGNAQALSGTAPVSSSFQDTMNAIRKDPSQFQAGDISLGQLNASQVDAPMGVSPSQLTSYQMQGPRLIDPSKAAIDPHYVQGQNLTQYSANVPGAIQGQSYNPSTSLGVRDVQGGQIKTGAFVDPNVAGQYMSPYQTAVNDVRMKAAQRSYDEQKAARQASAVRAGAFGGSREAVANSLAERDMLTAKDRIMAEGQQSAYENAQAQYERDRAAKLTADQFSAQSRLQGDLANQQTGLAAGQANQQAANQAAQFGAASKQAAAVSNQGAEQQTGLANLQSYLQTQGLGANLGQQGNLANQAAYMEAAGKNQAVNLQSELANQGALQQANQANLAASLDVQKLGADQSLTSQQSNQAAGLQAGLANLQAAQQTQALARTSGLDAAKSNQGTRLTQNQALLDAAAREDQLRQQSQQANFSNQLNAIGQQTNSALASNTIGQSRADLQRLAQATELQRLMQQQNAGATIDARSQNNLDMTYQDFINQKNDPYSKLSWLQGLYSGVPQGYNQEQVLFNRTNPAAQIGGLATAGLGALTSSLGKKKGGLLKNNKPVVLVKRQDGSWATK